MTVYIHPADQGPIDTAKRDRCSTCDEGLRRKGKRIWTASTRPSDRHKCRTHIKVCPACKSTLSYHDETLRCIRCSAYVSAFEITLIDRSEGIVCCPSCEARANGKELFENVTPRHE